MGRKEYLQYLYDFYIARILHEINDAVKILSRTYDWSHSGGLLLPLIPGVCLVRNVASPLYLVPGMSVNSREFSQMRKMEEILVWKIRYRRFTPQTSIMSLIGT